jgi:hypothetical protein
MNFNNTTNFSQDELLAEYESPTSKYVNGGIKKIVELGLITAGVFIGSKAMSPELISSIESAMFSVLKGIGFSEGMGLGLIISKIAGLGIVAGALVMKLP